MLVKRCADEYKACIRNRRAWVLCRGIDPCYRRGGGRLQRGREPLQPGQRLHHGRHRPSSVRAHQDGGARSGTVHLCASQGTGAQPASDRDDPAAAQAAAEGLSGGGPQLHPTAHQSPAAATSDRQAAARRKGAPPAATAVQPHRRSAARRHALRHCAALRRYRVRGQGAQRPAEHGGQARSAAGAASGGKGARPARESRPVRQGRAPHRRGHGREALRGQGAACGRGRPASVPASRGAGEAAHHQGRRRAHGRRQGKDGETGRHGDRCRAAARRQRAANSAGRFAAR